MIKLFLDIETIPADESIKAGLESDIRPPRNLSRPESLERWEAEAKPERVEDTFRKTALRGHQGRILCVGYIKETERGVAEDVISGLEPSILRYFWDLAKDVDLFVGFNILNFDLRFIVQRSIIHGIEPTRRLPFARYRSEPVYDVMQEWECWGREYIKLGELAEAELYASQVLEDTHDLVLFFGDSAYSFDDFRVLLVGPVGEVQPSAVHPIGDQPAERFLVVRGGSNCDDNLGLAHCSRLKFQRCNYGVAPASCSVIHNVDGNTETITRFRQIPAIILRLMTCHLAGHLTGRTLSTRRHSIFVVMFSVSDSFLKVNSQNRTT